MHILLSAAAYTSVSHLHPWSDLRHATTQAAQRKNAAPDAAAANPKAKQSLWGSRRKEAAPVAAPPAGPPKVEVVDKDGNRWVPWHTFQILLPEL